MMQEQTDRGFFDGSCDPNPGGRMGAGWRLLYDGQEKSGSFSWEPAPTNTNNVGEYQGLILVLKAYLSTGRQGPLAVHGDSQLVIKQMNKLWGVSSPTLYQLNKEARGLCDEVPGGVTFSWIPREQNAKADALAGGQREEMQREWTPREGFLPALSIQQPFATAILLGKKTIELRTWATSYRGWLLLHAGKSWYREREMGASYAAHEAKETMTRLGLPKDEAAYPLGAIVGIAQLVRCSRFTEEGWSRMCAEHASDGYWASHIIGWQLKDVQPFAQSVPCRGQLGLFAVETALVAEQLGGF